MALCTLQLCVTYKWWVKPYVNACILFAWLTGMEPDCEKIVDTMLKGMKLSISPEPFTAKG